MNIFHGNLNEAIAANETATFRFPWKIFLKKKLTFRMHFQVFVKNTKTFDDLV